MTLDLDAIKARLAAVRPYPWTDCGNDGTIGSANGRIVLSASASAKCPRAGDYYECDGPEIERRIFLPPAERAMILNAPADLAALVAEVERLTAERDAIRAAAIEEAAAVADMWSSVEIDRRDDELADKNIAAALTRARQAQTASDIAAAIRALTPKEEA